MLKLKVYEAPEPGDIIWENLNISFRERLERGVVTGVLGFFLICVCFFAVWGISLLQGKAIEDAKEKAEAEGLEKLERDTYYTL